MVFFGGGVNVKSGPRTKASTTFWNSNSISLLKTYLDSNTAPNSNNLEISGYNLIRSDHQSNRKRRGVCIYCKQFLESDILTHQIFA